MYFLQTSLAEVFYNSLVSGNLTDILSELNIAILTLLFFSILLFLVFYLATRYEPEVCELIIHPRVLENIFF